MSQPETSLLTPHQDPARRQFLALALVASGTVLGARLAHLALRFGQPVSAAGEYGGVFDLGLLTDVPGVDELPVHVPAGRFYLVQTEDGLLALRQVCAHLDCLLGWDQQSRRFLCPCHGSQFAADGRVLSGPATRSLDRFTVRLTTAEGEIVAESDAASGAALPVPASARTAPSSDDSAPAEEAPVLIVWVDTGRRVAVPSSQ